MFQIKQESIFFRSFNQILLSVFVHAAIIEYDLWGEQVGDRRNGPP
jgi:hypothetical protein